MEIINQKRVLILGASRYFIKCIESARAAGYYIITVDRNPKSEGFSFSNESYVCDIAEKEKILKIALKHNVSCIIPLSDIGVVVAAYVNEKLGLKGISQKSALLSTNKEEMRKRWINRNIPCPNIFVANKKKDFIKGIEIIGYPCIFKPAHGLGGGSKGVVVVNSNEELEDAIDFTQSFYCDTTTLIETFVELKSEHSAEVLIHNGKPYVIAISDKIKTKIPYRVDKNVIYPTKVKGKKLAKLKEHIINSVIALDIDIGVAHVEIGITNNGYVLFELGARCGGGGTPDPIVSFSTGVSEFIELIRILVGETPINLEPVHEKGSSYHFFTPNPGRIKKISGIEKIKEIEGVLDFEFFKKPGDEIVKVKTGSDRSGFVIIGDDSRDTAYQKGIDIEKLIKIEYE